MSRFISFQEYIEIAIAISFIGILGILSNKKNLLISLISIELMFYGLNLLFLIISLYLDDVKGEIAAIFILTIAAADSALALALITVFFKIRGSIEIPEKLNEDLQNN
jgi:NADH-quinone oxidoreductase subunit K